VNYDGFIEEELSHRKEYGYPPYRHLICHLFRSRSIEKLNFYCEAWAREVSRAFAEQSLRPVRQTPCGRSSGPDGEAKLERSDQGVGAQASQNNSLSNPPTSEDSGATGVEGVSGWAQGSFEVRGPAPAPIERIEGLYRYQLWYLCDDVETVIPKIMELRGKFSFDADITDSIDVDATQLM
jgi:primosomal protein N' (replication factor Y)